MGNDNRKSYKRMEFVRIHTMSWITLVMRLCTIFLGTIPSLLARRIRKFLPSNHLLSRIFLKRTSYLSPSPPCGFTIWKMSWKSLVYLLTKVSILFKIFTTLLTSKSQIFTSINGASMIWFVGIILKSYIALHE